MVGRVTYVESYRGLNALHRGDEEEARHVMLTVTLPLLVSYHNEWKTFVSFQSEQARKSDHEIAVSFEAARRQLVCLLGLAALMVLAIAYFTNQSLTNEMASRREAKALHRARMFWQRV